MRYFVSFVCVARSHLSDTDITPEFKGTGFRGYRAWLAETLGEEGLREFAEKNLAADLQQLFLVGPILPTNRYPIEMQHRFLEAFARARPSTYNRDLQAMGRTTARLDLSGAYKILLIFASVETTLGKLARVWNNYFNTGHARVLKSSPGLYIGEVTDPYQHALHRLIVSGYIEQTITMAGGKNAWVEIKDGPKPEISHFYGHWQHKE